MINKHNERKKREACIAAELDIIVKKEEGKRKNTFFFAEKTKQIISYHQFKLINLQVKSFLFI
jgi:hypothetical protein